MFTGIIEEKGEVVEIKRNGTDSFIRIRTKKSLMMFGSETVLR